MKLEKISDNQIRCTLTSEDLATREIKLSELAYGTDKAKNLFQDMMQQAQYEFGFDSDNSPLMVEAIPVAPDSIVLIITKVDDPEELDTRFSKFAPDNSDASSQDSVQFTGADDIIDIFQKLTEAQKRLQEKERKKKTKKPEHPAETTDTTESLEKPVNLVEAFHFRSLDDVILSARGLGGFFTGQNALYRDDRSEEYQLVLHQSGYSPEDFNKVCNILSEYGAGSSFSAASEAFLREHGNVIIADHALQKLMEL